MIKDLLQFIDNSPTPYHAVETVKKKLSQEQYILADTAFAWRELSKLPEQNLKIMSVKNASTIFFAQIPPELTPHSKIILLGAHTDSPNLRLKPHASFKKENLWQLSVEPYGGVLLSTWLDRDLGLAGMVSYQNDEGTLENELFQFSKALARVPNVAIHLNRDVNDKGLILDKSKHILPIFAADFPNNFSENFSEKKDFEKNGAQDVLVSWLAKQMNLPPQKIIDFDLSLFDLQPSTLGGAHNEFIFAPRLDNLAMCHAILQSVLAHTTKNNIVIGALFDHEEVGSQTNSGACSTALKNFIEQILHLKGIDLHTQHQIFQNSFFVSADMAHATHPNYVEKHDAQHKIYLNRGPVLKYNHNQRYATTAKSSAKIISVAREKNIPLQKFSANAAIGCGSTIGPIIAANLGFDTIDIGNPMLSMHSIRETAAGKDHEDIIKLFSTILEEV